MLRMDVPHYLLLYTLLPALIAVASLYAWAGICFAFLRFARPETDQRLGAFLANNRRYFGHRLVTENPRWVTRADVARAGLLGWNFVPLAFIGMNAGHLAMHSVVLGIGLLFFGGSIFARSWYGRRCMRLLSIDTVGEQTA